MTLLDETHQQKEGTLKNRYTPPFLQRPLEDSFLAAGVHFQAVALAAHDLGGHVVGGASGKAAQVLFFSA